MLESITLKFTEVDNLTVPTQGVTIFVGPNNSGKSLVLKEIEQHFIHQENLPTKILSDYKIVWLSEEQAERDIDALSQKLPHRSEGRVLLGRYNPQGENETLEHNKSTLLKHLRGQENYRWITATFLRFFMVRLDGRTRFQLVNDRAQGDLLAPRPQNFLAHLFKDDNLRAQVRDLVHDAFGVYFVIDALAGGQLRIRLSPTKPDHSEQSINAEARAFHENATHISQASDGVQAFVGIMAAVYSGEYRVILIDEPEAFLHPPLARKLGHELTSIVSRRGGVLLASTHSADFLVGCLQASASVRVVRLEYSNQKSKGKIVDSEILSRFFKTPLMRSANVISALFHDGVVVTESDNDRVFYSEIYQRLAEQEKGYPSILFVNAQNKQTIQDIIGPLREFGMPAAAIVDIDFLKDGGKTWTGWMQSIRAPLTSHNAYGMLRGNLMKLFETEGANMKADGINALPAQERPAANQLFDMLAQYGLFAVRNGELESWLKELNAVGKKTDWTIDILSKMGNDPNEPSYLKPAKGDVWDFMRGIVAWVKNPARMGTT